MNKFLAYRIHFEKLGSNFIADVKNYKNDFNINNINHLQAAPISILFNIKMRFAFMETITKTKDCFMIGNIRFSFFGNQIILPEIVIFAT